MERRNDYDYREVITDRPRAYCNLLERLARKAGYSVHIDYSRTSKSAYMTISELNMRIRIADHKRMGYPPYKYIAPKTKKWWEFWK